MTAEHIVFNTGRTTNPFYEERNMTIEELVEEFRAEREQLFKRYEEEREAFARNWLLARGWDGRDMEQARKLAEGWTIEHKLEDDKLTLTMVKDDTEGEE